MTLEEIEAVIRDDMSKRGVDLDFLALVVNQYIFGYQLDIYAPHLLSVKFDLNELPTLLETVFDHLVFMCEERLRFQFDVIEQEGPWTKIQFGPAAKPQAMDIYQTILYEGHEAPTVVTENIPVPVKFYSCSIPTTLAVMLKLKVV